MSVRSEKFDRYAAASTLTSKAFKDIAMSLGVNYSTKDIISLKNEEAIKNAIKNLILTGLGTKLFQPNVGSRVYNLLFEPLDPILVTEIRDEIINTVNNFDSRIIISDVNVIGYEDSNELDVEITYTIVGQPIVQSIDFILKRAE
jgi:phage baseplate assembly protein W